MHHYKQLYAKKFENVGEVDKLPEKYHLPKLNEEEAESLNILTTTDEIETEIKKLWAYKSPGLDGLRGGFCKIFKEELTPVFHKVFQKILEKG